MSLAVSIVIPAQNEGLHLFSTVHAIEATTRPGTYEIIVVDDGSHDGCAEFFVDDPTSHRRYLRTEGVGPSVARNLGASLARAEVVMFLDGHCYPHTNWMEPVLEAVSRRPRAMVTGEIYDAGGRAGARGWGLSLTSPGFDVQWLPEPSSGQHTVPAAGSAFMAMRVSEYFRAGGFYPLPVIGLEDVEISIRWWLLGGEIVVVPEARVGHVFAGPWRPGVPRTEHVFNGLALAALHLDGRARALSFGWYAAQSGYREGLDRLVSRGVWDDAAELRARRTLSFDQYCERFGLGAWGARSASTNGTLRVPRQ